MPETHLTDRGKRLLQAAIVLSVFTLIFRDIVLLLALIVTVSLPIYDFLSVRSTVRTVEGEAETEPSEIEEELTAGDEYIQKIELRNLPDRRLDYGSPLEDARIEDVARDGDEATLTLSYRPELAGTREADSVNFSVTGMLGLVEGSGEISANMNFRTRPRIMAAAVAAAGFLAGGAGTGAGEQTMQLKGAGLEYAGSREYRPGDDLGDMDWKATARLGRPIVKEYYLEGGGRVHLVFEAAAPDQVSIDKLSTQFLNLTTVLARREVPLGLTIHDGREVKVHTPEANPKEAVALALRHALRAVQVEVEELYDVLEPRTSGEVRRILQRVDREPLEKFLEAQLRIRVGEESPYRVLEDLVKEAGGDMQVALASSLWSDIGPLLEFEDYAREKGVNISVLQPTRPWNQCEDLEEGYRTRERYSRIHRVLENRGLSLSGSSEELVREIGRSRGISRSLR